jgi:uncharacterized protein with ParB-like and HNH nuclease domain
MDLKGAEIRNFFQITEDIPKSASRAKWPKDVKIPLYQRPYQWGEEQIKKLVEDHLNEPGTTYFAGSVVTVNDSKTTWHELIDGQQRYTTIYLTNFIAFLLARVLIREAIQRSKTIPMVELIEVLKQSTLYLFKQRESSSPQNANDARETPINESQSIQANSIEDVFTDFSCQVTQVFSQDNPQQEAKQDLLTLLENVSGLPAGCKQGEPSYRVECESSFMRFLSNKSLRLDYDRAIFSSRLIRALTYVTITITSEDDPQFIINDKAADTDANVGVYVSALKAIFEAFDKTGADNDSFVKAKNMLNHIRKFLEEVMLCVVQTGNARDAFTLFEVLNDRSLSLSELDLIKNQFYKTYVLLNRQKSELELDRDLQVVDDLWVKDIFDGERTAKSNLISYLAISYLSGSENATHKNSKTIREALEEYLTNKKTYSGHELYRDICVFSYCKSFIDVAGLKFNRVEAEALCDAYAPNKSLVFKVSSYLLASGQESVLAGLICYVIKVITNKHGNYPTPNIFENELKQLSDNETPSITKQAQYLWQVSILSKHATASQGPRENAKKLIKENNLNTGEPIESLNAAAPKLYREFEDWLRAWTYNESGSGKFKIRYLFALLMGLSATDSQLTKSTYRLSIKPDDVKKLHLDHMEPASPDINHPDSYFKHQNREQHVNGLGNMMPLPGEDNTGKSNKPMYPSAFDAMKNAGLGGHFLYGLTETCFNENNVNDVPTESFFNHRKDRLIALFKQVVEL